MRIFFDTEFMEDGKTIELLSIGMIRDDGEKYYAEVSPSEVDYSKMNPWVVENVLPHLRGGKNYKNRARIAQEIKEFVGPDPEFWAYYADYDWVVLCQLYGRMLDLPEGWPMFCRDLRQVMDFNLPLAYVLKEQIPNLAEHDALADATWNRNLALMLASADFGGL